MIKALFLDIDGTMVSFQSHCVLPATAESLLKVRENGVQTFVSTGRFSADINNLGDLPFDGYITLNGACCMRSLAAGEEAIYKHSIPQSDVIAFINYDETIERTPCYFVGTEGVLANGRFEILDRMSKLVEFPPRDVKPSRYFADKEILQLTAFFPQEKEETVMSYLPNCQATRWYPTFADVVALGVDKSVGIQKMCEHYGFAPDEVMAFGDGGNDISMLRYAGVGVAMGNAEDDVKKNADFVTQTVDNDGIGFALRHFGLI